MMSLTWAALSPLPAMRMSCSGFTRFLPAATTKPDQERAHDGSQFWLRTVRAPGRRLDGLLGPRRHDGAGGGAVHPPPDRRLARPQDAMFGAREAEADL